MKTKYQILLVLAALCMLPIILIASLCTGKGVTIHSPVSSGSILKDVNSTIASHLSHHNLTIPIATKYDMNSTENIELQFLKSDVVDLDIYQNNISRLPSAIKKSLPSKELVVYTTHLYRAENGSSYVIFLIGAGPTVYKSRSVIGCGVNDQYGKSFKIRFTYEDIRQHRWQKSKKENIHRYQQLVVECYGLEVKKGNKAFLVYHNTTLNQTVKIYSHAPVVIPAPKQTPKKGKVSSVVCTKVLTRGVSWLPEFLRYQKTLGVDHVHVSILDTLIKDGGFMDILANDIFFTDSIKNNYITVEVWKEWYDPKKWEWFYYGNMLMYLDCIYRYRGTYDFVSLFDTDDFFTIRLPGMSYNDFLIKYCLQKGIGSCSFKWLFYYPGVCGYRKVGEDGNVTASMVPHPPRNEQHNNYKSTHLSSAVIDSSFHDASCNVCTVKGYRAILVPLSIAYVAHNRLHKKSAVCH